MVWVILTLTVAAIPLLVAVVLWELAEFREGREVAELSREAEQLPASIAHFSQADARKGLSLLARASELPTRLPSEIPAIAGLWERRHTLQDLVSRAGHSREWDSLIVRPGQHSAFRGFGEEPSYRSLLANLIEKRTEPMTELPPIKEKPETQVDVPAAVEGPLKREIEDKPQLEFA